MDITITITAIMIMIIRKVKIFLTLLLTLIFTACSINPGLKSANFNRDLEIINLNSKNFENLNIETEVYKISEGDKLAVVVFGLEEVFPSTAISTNYSPLVNRSVDENGEIFFPYIGILKVANKTISEIRREITNKLAGEFKDPQIDVSVTEFNANRNVYLIGEVVRPKTLSIGLNALTLADAISQAEGLSPITSNPRAVYIVRKSMNSEEYGTVYKVNLSSIAEFANLPFAIEPANCELVIVPLRLEV